MESMGFVFMYIMKGTLPWQGLRAKTKKEKYEKIRDKKVSTSFEALCKGHSEEFMIYLNYCHALNFEERPDYNYCRKIFRDLFTKKGFEADFIFDWMLQKPVIVLLGCCCEQNDYECRRTRECKCSSGQASGGG